MPGPWRHQNTAATRENTAVFQSQTRCQAPGDVGIYRAGRTIYEISISDEMPGPWRLWHVLRDRAIDSYFNLSRDARPLATAVRLVWPVKRIHDVVREGDTLLPLFRGLCCSMR